MPPDRVWPLDLSTIIARARREAVFILTASGVFGNVINNYHTLAVSPTIKSQQVGCISPFIVVVQFHVYK